MSKEAESCQEYITPNGVMSDLMNHYVERLKVASTARDKKESAIAIACITAINPPVYKQHLEKKRRKEK
jgi:hypothetical protein